MLDSADVSGRIADLRAGVVADLFRQFVPEESVEEQWNVSGLETALAAELGLELPLKSWLEMEPELTDEALLERVTARAHEAYAAKIPPGAEASFREYERYVTLQILDAHWRDHLAALDHLRQGIHLRGYAQKNPKQEYKREAFELFGTMLEAVKLEIPKADDQQHVENVQMQHASLEGPVEEDSGDVALASVAVKKPQPMVRSTTKIGRNDPCPCGSGRKYKHCHGKLT
jgi:preprotein translocase subunit SecA